MGKKRKGGVKKRDGGLSGLQDAVSDEETGVLGEDGIMGEVDQWEKGEDERILSKVKFRGKRKEEDGAQEMFALSGTDSDSDLELPTLKKLKKKKKASKQQEEVNASDIESEGDQNEDGDLRKWGTKKKHYYGGNTGEEIDEDLDESDLEEDKMEEMEAAKLQSRQLEMMEEEDFLDAFVPKKSEDGKKSKTDKKTEATVDSVTKDLSKLSAKEQGKLFRQQNPEFDGVVADFNMRMKEAIKLSKLVSLADAGEIPEGPVLDLIRYKLEILLNYCTNISAYLMFKSQGVSLTLHPVTTRLVQFRQLIDKVETLDTEVSEQVDKLVNRLDAGESIKTLVKEERRRIKRDNERLNKSKIKFADKQKQDSKKTKKKKKAKKIVEPAENAEKEDENEDLTRDERMALEVYDAVRKNKRKLEDSEEEATNGDDEENNEEDSDDDEERQEDVNTYNDENEDLEDDDIDEKRAITYKIAKNKGLTPKRSKLQRNPRVKNRMKYTKALKRRKGAVREVREQTSKYGGEASGINMRVKKGVKFN